MRVQGKVAIVTGGGGGIGRAAAVTLAKEGGADVVVWDIDGEAAQKAADEVKSAGRQALAMKGDLSKSEDVRRLFEETLNIFGKIDILVNCAGGQSGAEPAEETTEERWDRDIASNLKAVFLCCQVVSKQMIKQGYGKIINIASTCGHVALPFMLPYHAAKGGVLQLTKVLGVALAKYNINVNSVSPGITVTPLLEGMFKIDPTLPARVKRLPLKRPNQPQDVANAILFLASAGSDNMVGQDIIVDGGRCALDSMYVFPQAD